jgi:anaerobic magnesium-protoporphyrin IX monomethyl ester cyclase
MDILLIDPPYTSLKCMPMDRGYNIGLTSLAAYLHREGIETAVLMGDLLIDKQDGIFRSILPGANQDVKKYAVGQTNYEMIVEDKTHHVWRNMIDIISEHKPKYIGISYMTPLKCVVERIAGIVKELDPDIKIIVGSFHPTFCPDEVMQNEDIDFVIRGEGEIPLLSLVTELKKDSPRFDSIPGIHYRDVDGTVRSNPNGTLISNLDELPFPGRDLVLNCDYDVYKLHCIATARGCPYTCSFCSDRRLWGNTVRRRSVDNVLAELTLLKNNYKISYVDIVDGTFTFDRRYLKEFCIAMIEHKLNLKWRCTARYDNLDEELLELMKESNCAGMYFGLESGSDRVLQSANKKLTVEKIIKVSKMVHDAGITSAASILLGLPEERKEDVEETLKLMKKVKTDLIDVNSYIPLPGTGLYDSMTAEEKEGIDWRRTGYKSTYNYFSKNISREDFNKYRDEAYKIADDIRIKTIARFVYKILFSSITGIFKKPKVRSITPKSGDHYVAVPVSK